MKRRGAPDNRLSLVIMIALLVGLSACSGGSAASPAATNPSGDLAALKQQVATQETRIAALETRVALPQSTIAPARPATGAPTATAKPVQPTPTVIPPVAGLVTDGATKGAASAKVTITEYVDYL